MIDIDKIFEENNVWQIWTQDRKRYYAINLEFKPGAVEFQELNQLKLMDVSISQENIRSFSLMPGPCQEKLREHLLKKQNEENDGD